MADSLASGSERSQYHHFIPRFILRNYSHLSETPTSTQTSKKHSRRKNRSRPMEPMLYGIHLAGEEPEIKETSVAKTFGMIDMYRDVSASTKQHHIEEQLSVLEAQAGAAISTIRKAFEAGKTEVWITRTQRDTLRKFLFIMKYRSSGFHSRYCHDNADDYDSDDRETMLRYMKEKGIKKPIDVWFDNIKGILDLKMDCGLAWMEKLSKRIYPDDAEWFINNVQQFYMALVTPANPDNEFLLTQNAYSIHEGAETNRVNPETGKMECSAYTEFHLFAPVTPRLLIVLRTFLLPVPEEDSNETIRAWREMNYKICTEPHLQPEAAGQLLRDLPIRKALNSYSKIVDGRVVLLNGGPTGASDRYGFRFFPLSEDYVNKINGIMLEESHRIDLIVFNNKGTTYKTLQNYLTSHNGYEFSSERAKGRMKLRQAATLLAPDISPQEAPRTLPILSSRRFPEDKLYALFVEEEKAKKLYFELSGKSVDTKDFDQARGLHYMRIKLDSSTRGLPQETREAQRNQFLELYDQFPAQVIWIYLKRIRFMKLGFTRIGSSNMLEDDVLPPQHLYGPEDVIAASRSLFRKEAFCRVMHHASFNGFLIAKPMWGLVSELTLDENGLRRLQEEKELVLGTQGSICDCGIPELEAIAEGIREIVKENVQEFWHNNLDIFSEDEKIEILTRDLARGYEDEGTRKRLIEDPELEKILFDVVYPLFGFRHRVKVEDEEGVKVDKGWSCMVQ